MPFGAQALENGATRFRLWAPTASRAELLCSAPQGVRRLDMARDADGWCERTVEGVGHGDLYRFLVDGRLEVPDPASRFNPHDVQGPSMVVDPARFEWSDTEWHGRPWHEAVLYEVHVGTFTGEGTFGALQDRLGHLVELGVTALELMPVADFPGTRNWGYDGVLPFAPDARYGTPEDLKRLVDAAHRHGLMVLLDVVYNHFGPEGNYLHAYAADFFSERHRTPWGSAINFDGPGSRTVRDFYLHNVMYWLEEYRFDGLRFDAAHAIADDSQPGILEEIAQAVRTRFGSARHVHLILEDDRNSAHLLGHAARRPAAFDAQWNDDVHHCLHAAITGEHDGYYRDYVDAGDDFHTARLLARALAEGFAWQGEPSPSRGGELRGEPSAHLPPTAFVDFLQNHDQTGNRALGDRIGRLAPAPALRAAVSILLLSPHVPLLFMGEEWNAPEPFLFFCEFDPELAAKVREGRRREFADFQRFHDPEARLLIPDPCDPATFERSRLDLAMAQHEPHRGWLALYRHLLGLRHREIIPRLPGCRSLEGGVGTHGEICVRWHMGDGAVLRLLANLGPTSTTRPMHTGGRLLYTTHPEFGAAHTGSALAPWCVVWSLGSAHG
ncbi:MAG: malto-oligosyltrehalose trehalohydrolase [Burkholderiales bacterium]|nr:malto-oligosyltrehalose trehalohydrolase [Burkholderiales bacterium]